MEPSGYLLLHKPCGITSHDAVDTVRRALHTKRVGHAGTLDPMAEGLLIMGVGSATKTLQEILGLPKAYDAEITLGATSDTDDAMGVMTPRENTPVPSAERVEEVLQEFQGDILQTPPVYSAKKVRGVPAHRRIRRGETVTLAPRTVTIHALTLRAYDYPLLSVSVTVSSGTYIRALARDIGEALGCGAYLSKLVRTAIGPYLLIDAVRLNDLSAAALRPTLDAPTSFP